MGFSRRIACLSPGPSVATIGTGWEEPKDGGSLHFRRCLRQDDQDKAATSDIRFRL